MLFVIFSAYVTEVVFSSFTILSDPEGISSGLRQNFSLFFSKMPHTGCDGQYVRTSLQGREIHRKYRVFAQETLRKTNKIPDYAHFYACKAAVNVL